MEDRIYISGKITGKEDYIQDFERAEKHLLERGYRYISNPTKVTSHLSPHIHSWEQYMLLCIEELFKCKIIYMISGWESSRGACIEHDIAKRLGYAIIYE